MLQGRYTVTPALPSGRGNWRVGQAEQLSELAQGDLEHRRRIVQREVQVPEYLQAHRPVQPDPAAQEDHYRTDRQVRPKPLAIALQLRPQAGIELAGGGDAEWLPAPELQEERLAVSAITVAMALASLMLFPETFLRSMGYGGVATVLVDVLAALTVMPALLAVLGPRVNALRIRRRVAAPRGPDASGAWYRLARSVMRRPVVYAAVIVVVLLALGSPFLRVTWGGTDAQAPPPGAGPRVVTSALNKDFPGYPTAPIEAVATFGAPVAGSPARGAALASYLRRLHQVPGITGARLTGVRGAVARVDMRYRPGPLTSQARAIVGQVRKVAPPGGARVAWAALPRSWWTSWRSLGRSLPWMALIVAVATFVLLFLAFGSIVLPVKAIVMNVLSLSATFGAVVWIFQDGHLSGPAALHATGTIDPTMPILMLAIIFGLSMDYEVFLLSRIRERYDVTGDNTTAIAGGLQRTGGLITSLALLLVIVIGAFSASGITFIKLMGVGMIIALIVDATIVRVPLVPATMRLLGRANWWAPGPLRGLYGRYGIREAPGEQRGPVPVPVRVPR